MTSTEPLAIDPLEIEPIFMDVSWFSDDQRLERALDALFEITSFKTLKKRKDAVLSLKKHLKAVVIVCLRAMAVDPEGLILCPRSNNFGKESYKSNFTPMNPRKYNFKKIREIIDGLKRKEFVELYIGRQGRFQGVYQRKASRFKITPIFIDFLSNYDLADIEFKKELINGGIVISNNKNGSKSIVVDYSKIPEPDDVTDSRGVLERYNQLIQRSKIELIHKVSKQVIDTKNNVSWRVFHQNNFNYGGRYYGGWWTYCSREDRQFIAINGEPTVECDYTSSHLHLFYGLNNAQIPDKYRKDPYTIEGYPRRIIKILITRHFNCQGQYGIVNHIASILRYGGEEEDEENMRLIREHLSSPRECREVMDAIYQAHPILRNSVDDNQGSILMNWDSKIATYVLNVMTSEGIPVLCIHDSFIVAKQHREALVEAMNGAFDALGIPHAKSPIEEKYSKLVKKVDGSIVTYV